MSIIGLFASALSTSLWLYPPLPAAPKPPSAGFFCITASLMSLASPPGCASSPPARSMRSR